MTASLAPITAAQVRAAMFGTPVDGLRVVHQAWRVSDNDSDELALLCVRERSWWVARRLSDQIAVWAFAGDDEAWAGFERLMANTDTGDGWTEASEAPLAG